jgi:CheY-like chemotaxis protein
MKGSTLERTVEVTDALLRANREMLLVVRGKVSPSPSRFRDPRRLLMDDSGTKEDNQNDGELIPAALKERRLVKEICAAREGQEALEDLYEIKLPKVDRLQVLQRIKTGPDLKATTVVMLTISREERDLLRSYNLGENACVIKSMRFRFFTETVNQAGLFWGGHQSAT